MQTKEKQYEKQTQHSSLEFSGATVYMKVVCEHFGSVEEKMNLNFHIHDASE